MEYRIRPCRLDDARAICCLSRTELGYDYPLDAVRKKLKALLGKDSERILVAEAEGVVVGYIHAADYDVLYAPHMKNIMGIAVSGYCRRHGVGRALLAAIEAWARDTGASGVRLVSGETRTGAHEFYCRCGYDTNKKQVNFRKIF